MENMNIGGGRMQEIERLLLEARMTNARLMEDNESYQLLLSQKTLTGDFHHSEFMGHASNEHALSALEGRSIGSTTLADELSQSDSQEGEDESANRRLEAELKASKAENKALTLYINKIIERLLQHQDFEAILDQSSDFKPGATGAANVDKDLPPPPPQGQNAGTSILQRAKSVALGAGQTLASTRRPRPQSQMPAAHSALTDPDTAPSIPFGLGRSSSFRGRPKSEQYTGGAANVVNQMYKGNGQVSPPIHGPQTPRHSQSFFTPIPVGGGGNPNASARMPSYGSAGNFPGQGGGPGSSSGESGEVSTPGNSPPRKEREKNGAEEKTKFKGNQPRPLRLVQDHPENNAGQRRVTSAEEMQAKRSSWMGNWFGGKKAEDGIGENSIIPE